MTFKKVDYIKQFYQKSAQSSSESERSSESRMEKDLKLKLKMIPDEDNLSSGLVEYYNKLMDLKKNYMNYTYILNVLKKEFTFFKEYVMMQMYVAI